MNPHEHVESFRPIESQNYYYILSEFDLKRMLLLGDMSQRPFLRDTGLGGRRSAITSLIYSIYSINIKKTYETT